MECGVPVVPVGMQGTERIQPRGSRWFRPFLPVVVRFGPPMHFDSAGLVDAETGRTSSERLRAFTDELMAEIARLAEHPYIDELIMQSTEEVDLGTEASEPTRAQAQPRERSTARSQSGIAGRRPASASRSGPRTRCRACHSEASSSREPQTPRPGRPASRRRARWTRSRRAGRPGPAADRPAAAGGGPWRRRRRRRAASVGAVPASAPSRRPSPGRCRRWTRPPPGPAGPGPSLA